MPRPIFSTLPLDELAQQAAPRSEPHGSDRAYLASVGALAAVIIGVFFGIGFSFLVTEQLIDGSGAGNRGTETKSLNSIGLPASSSDGQPVPVDVELPPSTAVVSLPALAHAHRLRAREDEMPENTTLAGSSVSADSEAKISGAAGAVSGTGAPAVGSTASETTLARSTTVSPSERASSSPVASTAALPPLAAETTELLARGDSFVVVGDIASARVFYERAANAGEGQAALRMATTFDPAFLRRAGLPRRFGDPVQARSWYHRAFDRAVEAEPVKSPRPGK